jgi:hypothetical protein
MLRGAPLLGNPMISSSSDPKLLVGARAIARFLEIKEQQVYHFSRNHELPIFRIGKSLCARPASLTRWVTKRARGQP